MKSFIIHGKESFFFFYKYTEWRHRGDPVIGLMLREICKSKQMTDFIAWPSRLQDTIYVVFRYKQKFYDAIKVSPFLFNSERNSNLGSTTTTSVCLSIVVCKAL